MKHLFLKIVLLLFTTNIIYSQKLTDKEIYKLKKLDLNVKEANLSDSSFQLNLKNILALERKRMKNKTVAIVFTSLSAVSVMLGGALLTKKSESFVGEILGTTFIAGGVVYGGVSIPFWVSSNKRKKRKRSFYRFIRKITSKITFKIVRHFVNV